MCFEKRHKASPTSRGLSALAAQMGQVEWREGEPPFAQRLEENRRRVEVVEILEFVDECGRRFEVVLAQEVVEEVFALFLFFASGAAQCSSDFSFGLSCGDIGEPLGADGGRLGSEDFDLVAAGEAVAHRDEVVVDFCTDAVAANHGVDGKGKVEHGSALWEGDDFTLGGEDVELAGKEVELDGVEQVERVGLWVVEDFLDGVDPRVEFMLIVGRVLVLILPVGGKSPFGNVVHAVGADLHLNPLALVGHEGVVEGLVAVGFGSGEPVAEARGMRFVDLRECGVDAVALIDFLLAVARSEDDADGQDVVDLLKGDVLALHLLPDAVRALDAGFEFVVHAHPVERLADGRCEVVDGIVALHLRAFEVVEHELIVVGMLVFEGKVFQFGLDAVEPETVGKGREDVEGFAHNLVLLGGQHGRKCAHVVKAVGNLDEDDADVVAHGEENLLERLCLHRGAVAKEATRHLGDAFHDVGHLLAEEIGHVFAGVVGVFDHIVEQGGTDARGAESDFTADDLCHRERVEDVGFAATPTDTFVSRLCKVEGAGDDVGLFAMRRGEVSVQ